MFCLFVSFGWGLASYSFLVQFCLFGLRDSISSITGTGLGLALTTNMYDIAIGPGIVRAAPVLTKMT